MGAEWFLYRCSKCGMSCVVGKEGGKLDCQQEPCSASGDEVSVAPLVPEKEFRTMNEMIGVHA